VLRSRLIQGRIMTKVQPSKSICPKCRKTMKMMLAESGQRALRCIDCAQPDPMRDAETNRWLNGDLRKAD
jgi:tRNA(Ile2) C34 agmatinyltransferase TiaS